MRWRQGRQSTNVRDVRGRRMAGGAGLGGGALVIMLIVWLLGGNPLQFLQTEGGGAPQAPVGETPPPTDEAGQFMSAILAMTEDVWTEIFAASGERYVPPTMILFSGAIQSACGYSSSATGPFYCPGDQSLYLDTSFFEALARMGGPGDFAQAYVVGHEVGHHVQNLVGALQRANELQRSARGEAEANRLQVLIELQADCYAGVWAHHANQRQQVLEPGDVQEGLQAAAAIGDDRLAREAGRSAVPESFTHGTSEQRQQWLGTGLELGDVSACNTF